VPAHTTDLHLGAESALASSLAATMGDWRRSTLAAVPASEETERERAQQRKASEETERERAEQRGASARGAPSGDAGASPRSRPQPLDGARLNLTRFSRTNRGSITPLLSLSPSKRASRTPSRSGGRSESKRRNSLQLRRALDGDPDEDDGLPSLSQKWQRVQATCLRGEGFQKADVEGMRVAFVRFQAPHENYVHKQDLVELVQYLGYVSTSVGDVEKLALEVTSYNHMDFDEFLIFMEKFSELETQRFRSFFAEFDKDQSGELSIKELRELMIAIGFIPNKLMIEEALEFVDNDGNGQLSFVEFVLFLTVYRHAQGFTRRQVRQMRHVFSRFAREGAGISHVEITPALCLVFGRHVETNATALAVRLLGQGWMRRGLSGAVTGDNAEDSLEFPEFLVFARRLKELESADYADQFQRHDSDQSGSISIVELMEVLRGKGYEPLRAPVLEVLREVVFHDTDPEKPELDFGEFFNFMEAYWEREGFLERELDEISRCFNLFVAPDKWNTNEAEISTKDVASMLQKMGYRVPGLELAQLVMELDVNHRGALYKFEAIRLTRMFRELEMRRLRNIFRKFATRREGAHPGAREQWLLESESLSKALTVALGENISSALHEISAAKSAKVKDGSGVTVSGSLAIRACVMALRTNYKAGSDFDAFVELVDLGRARRVDRDQSNAAFSEEELSEFEAYFAQLDVDKSGVIQVGPQLLTDLCIDWRTKEDQAFLLEILDSASAAASTVGAQVFHERGCLELSIGYPEFLHMLRLLLDQRRRCAEEVVEATSKVLHFSWSEVEQFRDVYNEWSTRESLGANDEVGRALAVNRLTLETIANMNDACGVSPAMLVNVVRSLGVNVTLQMKMDLVEQAKTQETNSRGQLTFIGFLRMIRWLMDCDFGGINGAAARTASTKAASYLRRPSGRPPSGPPPPAMAGRTAKRKPAESPPSSSPTAASPPTLSPSRQSRRSLKGASPCDSIRHEHAMPPPL
jgi:Ca2+-binding EF-hand superfamily protein